MTALNRCQGRAADPGGMFRDLADQALLAAPAGQQLRARIDAATCVETSRRFDRDSHVDQVTLLVMRAKGWS